MLLARGGTPPDCYLTGREAGVSVCGQGGRCECGGRGTQRHLRARVEGAEGRWAEGKGRAGTICVFYWSPVRRLWPPEGGSATGRWACAECDGAEERGTLREREVLQSEAELSVWEWARGEGSSIHPSSLLVPLREASCLQIIPQMKNWESPGSREGPAYTCSHLLGPQTAINLRFCGGGTGKQDHWACAG